MAENPPTDAAEPRHADRHADPLREAQPAANVAAAADDLGGGAVVVAVAGDALPPARTRRWAERPPMAAAPLLDGRAQ